MKFVSIDQNGNDNLGILNEGSIYLTEDLGPGIPGNMGSFLENWQENLDKIRKLEDRIRNGDLREKGIPEKEAKILAPVPHPVTCRDAYAFRQHVATARRNRGVDMIPQFDQFPVFYFTNPHSTFGPGKITLMPDHFKRLDFELEIAIVIGKQGRNIRASEADEHIAGFMIMNDLSARQLQMEEMKLNLGPAKGKDMANTFGPYLVTPEQLSGYLTAPKKDHTGNAYSLTMKAYHNGENISGGNFSDMDWTFAEILERVSYGIDVYPGEVIGSGTVGTGCYMELNGTRKLQNPDYQPVWLKDGDEITLEVEELGTLTNHLVKSSTDYSLLDLKKNV